MKTYIKINIIAISLISIFAFSACDEIDYPYRQSPGSITPTGDTVRKILLEEFTGFKCKNCPHAHELVENLKTTYKTQIIPISIHAGYNAIPNTTEPYTYDFRTSVGNDLYNTYDIPYTPAGVVNRQKYENSIYSTYTKWEEIIQTYLKNVPDFLIKMNASYNSINTSFDLTVDITYLKEGDPKQYLSVYIVEDSIVKPQLNGGDNVLEYVHNHVLRASINETWGSPIKNSVVAKGSTITKEFSYTLPKDGNSQLLWRPNKIKLIAFIYNNDGSIGEVLQAEEISLISTK